MKLGKINNIFFVLALIFNSFLFAEEKISTVPLINLENLEPSYEEIDTQSVNDDNYQSNNLKLKKNQKNETKLPSVNLIGLDKITAKTSSINIKIGEIKKFGFLEIKAVKCGKVSSATEKGQAAYLQVRDLSDSQNEKIYVFNGWTFSSSPSLRPIDHPIYDLWLINCENV
jgi:hypothetical protein